MRKANTERENGVGGLVGSNVSGAKLTLKDCSVKNTEISANIKNVASTTLEYPTSAGGAVGYSGGTIVLAGPVTTENLTITAPADASAEGFMDIPTGSLGNDLPFK